MTEFAQSEWSKREAATAFVETGDRYLVERPRMLRILRSLYHHFLTPRNGDRPRRLLDLGSGNGAMAHELLKDDAEIEATLIDASPEMLEQARRRLQPYAHVGLLQHSFQDLLRGQATLPMYDVVVSGLAIHHLDANEKKALFSYILDHLEPGGHFVNMDVVLADDASVEEWYMTLWREWIRETDARDPHTDQSLESIPQQYKDNPDNVPSALDEQLAALRDVGFRAVDCYYKYGVFAVYGGRK